MKKALIIALIFCVASSFAYAMYKEDTEPSEKDSQYMRDKEDMASITMPERETEMSEAEQTIRDEEKENPDEDYIEDNVTEEMRKDL